MGLLVSLLTFCIVIVLFFAIWMLVGGGDSKQEVVRRRMEAVRKAERRGDVSATLTLARDEMLSSVPLVHRMMMNWAWSIRLQEQISQAGLTMKAGKLVLISACAGLGTWLVVGLFYPQFPVALIFGFGAAAAPFLVINYLRHKRMRQF